MPKLWRFQRDSAKIQAFLAGILAGFSSDSKSIMASFEA
jgi:hypothetical protein